MEAIECVYHTKNEFWGIFNAKQKLLWTHKEAGYWNRGALKLYVCHMCIHANVHTAFKSIHTW